MVNQQLVNYIQTYHSKGYAISTLRDFLINEGYSSKDIEEAINLAYHPNHFQKSKSLIIIGVIILAIVVSALIFVIITSLGEDTVILDIKTTPLTNTIYKGENIDFTFTLDNVGSRENFQVSVVYALVKDNLEEFTSQRTIDSETEELSLSLTPKKLGFYQVRVRVYYFEEVRESSFTFKVLPVCGDGICDVDDCVEDCESVNSVPICGNNICEDGEEGVCEADCVVLPDLCGNDVCDDGEESSCSDDCDVNSCGDGVCDSDEDSLNCDVDCPISECGNNVCEGGETSISCLKDCNFDKGINAMTEYQVIKYIPVKVEEKGAVLASKECGTVTDSRIKDTCFYWVMKSSNSSVYCKQIENQNKKDDCYVSYAYNTDDYSVCSVINDGYKRETCDLLGKSHDVDSAYS